MPSTTFNLVSVCFCRHSSSHRRRRHSPFSSFEWNCWCVSVFAFDLNLQHFSKCFMHFREIFFRRALPLSLYSRFSFRWRTRRTQIALNVENVWNVGRYTSCIWRNVETLKSLLRNINANETRQCWLHTDFVPNEANRRRDTACVSYTVEADSATQTTTHQPPLIAVC